MYIFIYTFFSKFLFLYFPLYKLYITLFFIFIYILFCCVLVGNEYQRHLEFLVIVCCYIVCAMTLMTMMIFDDDNGDDDVSWVHYFFCTGK